MKRKRARDKLLKDFNIDKYQYIFGSDFDESEVSFEEILQSTVAYYESIIRCMPGNVYWLDKDCKTVGCNQNVLDMFSLDSINDFKGLSFKQLGQLGCWSKESEISFEKDTREVLSTGLPKLNIEEPPIPLPDDNVAYFLTSRVPIFNEKHQVIGVVGISIDITNRKKMEVELQEAKEKAEAASRAKSEFMTNISHDLRTPMTGVIAAPDILKDEVLSKDGRDMVNLMKDCANELLDMLNGVIQTVRDENMREDDIHESNFQLRESILHIKQLIHLSIKIKGLEFKEEVSPDFPQWIISDKTKIERIILNLIGNAVKFTDHGYIMVKAKLLKQEGSRLLIEISVEDTGIGISVEDQPKIFDRFFKVKASERVQYKGLGLGLYIVKHFTDLLNGEITLVSELGKGTKFSCIIPVQLGKEPAVELHDKRIVLPEHTLARLTGVAHETLQQHSKIASPNYIPKILVVEDSPIAFRAEDTILNRLNCQVEHAKDGKTAIDLATKNTYDLIFMDLGLPDLSGDAVTRELRKQEKPADKKMIIVGLTGSGEAEKRQLSLNAGMDEVIIKPLNQVTAQQILDRFLFGVAE